jgi:ADP-ribose pyrophosphatase YjhB (NUDIX family)
MAMNFCSNCGAATLELRIPDGDTLQRRVCATCGTIHYENPKIVAGCLPVWGERVLLCKRAIEPRHGLWTLPAGFLENGETLQSGALRETLEEADARVELGDLYTVISLPQIHQVYMMFRSRLLPWAELAFRTIARTLRNFFLDRRLGAFKLHVSSIERRAPLPPDLLAAG